MCFSNLPIEFDEDGNPSLAEDAEDVERPGCGCGEGEAADVALDETDPQEAFDDIVEAVPESVRAHLNVDAADSDRERDPAGDGRRPEAGSD